MAQLLQSVTLSAPSTDPNVDSGNSFSMTAALTWGGGHGGNESVDLHFEYSTSPGGPYSDVPASGSELTTANTNPASVTGSPVSITVAGAGAGTYYVRVRGIGSSSFSSVEQVVTVNAGAITGTLSAQESGVDIASMLGVVPASGLLVAQESGSDLVSVTGKALVDGAFSVQEAGSDTALFSGTVSDPSINATLSAQESGSDAAALNGSVLVNGSIATQEAGTDSAVLSGSVLIIGSVSGQESGSDGLSVSGSVLVTGSLVVQEAGTDTATINGSTGDSISGSLSAQEAGSDSFTANGSVAIDGALLAQDSGLDVASASGEVEVSGALNSQEAGSDTAAITGSTNAGITGSMAAQESGGLPPGNWVDIDDPVTIAQIADEVAARFNFNPDGDVLATLDGELTSGGGGGINEVQLNRAVQAAIPAPPSDEAIAREVVKNLPKPATYSKELKAIESKIAKLLKPKPESNTNATLRQELVNIRAAIAAIPQPEQLDAKPILEHFGKLKSIIQALPDYSESFTDLSSQLDEIMKSVSSSAQQIESEVKAIPQPDLSNLATKAELEAVNSVLAKLENYDDASVVALLNSLRGDSETIQNNQDIQDQKINLVLDNQIRI